MLACVAAVFGGLGAGVLGSFAHAATSYGVPVGLLAGLGLCLAVFVTAGLASRSRGPVACAVAGWGSVVLMFSAPRSEGDLVVAGNLLGYGWLVGGMVVGGAALCWPFSSTGGPPPDR